MEAIVIEYPIEEFKNEIPTQTSKTIMKVVEASIAAGTLKLAGSSVDEAWDVVEEYFGLNYVLVGGLSWRV
nr:hypothetical protein [Tanacetum cinerariifolium]